MLNNLDDPKTQLLMMMGLSLLGGAPGKNKNFGADLAHGGLLGLQGYSQAQQQQARLAERKQAQEMRDMQMAELKRSMADREGLRGAFQASMIPGQTTQPDPYEFDGMRDGSMPQPFTKPGSFDTQGFLGRAAPFMDPMQAVQFQQQLANANRPDYVSVAPGGSLFDKKAGKPVFQAPEKPPEGFTRNPDGSLKVDPAFKDFQFGKAAAGANRAVQNVNTYTPASEQAQKKFMDSVTETYGQLKLVPQALKNLEQTKALIPKAKGFMGPGGEGILAAAKFMNNRLGTSFDTSGVNAAEEIRTRGFLNVLDNLKKMDAQPSQMQQKVMMDAFGGLGTDPNALPKILDAYADALRDKVDIYNAEVKSSIDRGVKFPFDPIIKMENKADAKGIADGPTPLSLTIGGQVVTFPSAAALKAYKKQMGIP